LNASLGSTTKGSPLTEWFDKKEEVVMSSIPVTALGLASWERVALAVDEVRQRLLRVTAALEQAGIAYAVIGGNAVATWVGSVDKAAVRFTQDVDVLLKRDDLAVAQAALNAAGFHYHETLGVHMFLDNPQGNPREAVHVLFANEKVQPDYLVPTPDLSETAAGEHYRVLSLESLVRMKLTSYRRKDQVHIQDMIGVGLVDATWPARFPTALAQRLQELLDDPNG
jgi:hypothetical protein